jgi:hypothetical protein
VKQSESTQSSTNNRAFAAKQSVTIEAGNCVLQPSLVEGPVILGGPELSLLLS